MWHHCRSDWICSFLARSSIGPRGSISLFSQYGVVFLRSGYSAFLDDLDGVHGSFDCGCLSAFGSGSRCAIWPSFSFPRAGRTSSLVESVQFGQLLGCLGMDASFFSHWIYLESRGSRLEQYRSVAAICLYLGDLRT